jgi:hypothetical protein
MRSLKISKEISLPIDAVTQTLAAIGRKGAGKTYLATMIAEQMLDAHAQVVVIDPVGNWWGLRVGADGRSKGKEIFVIGGDHGDVPLVPEAGARIARLLVEKNISAVIDVSGFRIGEHKRFAADFAEEFFHLKKSHKTPVHVFIEEAQKIIPQRVGPEEARMVGAFEQIVRLGRNYGIGCTLITQRPQSVNKEVLSQVECVCALQMTGPHERKALEEWVQEAGADRKLVDYLPGLGRGEGYVWSPSWLRVFERVHFAAKSTFDASATPEVGKATKAASISAVDVAKLRADMAEVIEQAEKDDPAALKKRIRVLEAAQLKAPVETKTVEVPVLTDKQIKELDRILARLDGMAAAVVESLDEVRGAISLAFRSQAQAKPVPSVVMTPFAQVAKPPRRARATEPVEGVTGPEQRIANAVAWLNSIGVAEPNKTAVAFLAGYTYGSGGFNNPCGALRSKGLIEYRPGNKMVLTAAGGAVAQVPDEPLTQEALHEKVLGVLPGPEQRILKPLLEAGGEPMSSEDLAAASGYQFGSGGFNNPKGRLRTLGLIEYPSPGTAKASDILFL